MNRHTFKAMLAGLSIVMAAPCAAETAELDNVPLFEVPPIIVTPTHSPAPSPYRERIGAVDLKPRLVLSDTELHL